MEIEIWNVWEASPKEKGVCYGIEIRKLIECEYEQKKVREVRIVRQFCRVLVNESIKGIFILYEKIFEYGFHKLWIKTICLVRWKLQEVS